MVRVDKSSRSVGSARLWTPSFETLACFNRKFVAQLGAAFPQCSKDASCSIFQDFRRTELGEYRRKCTANIPASANRSSRGARTLGKSLSFAIRLVFSVAYTLTLRRSWGRWLAELLDDIRLRSRPHCIGHPFPMSRPSQPT